NVLVIEYDDTTQIYTLSLNDALPISLMEENSEMNEVQKEMAGTVLTAEEQEMVDSFASKIDVENTAQIMQYGAGTQKKMADFSEDRKSTRLNSSHVSSSYAVFCLKKK